ncbi:RHS repeat domain-containing protein, partial [Fulvivirga aurantia]|uniref:RHS repeat domain-containing protein n=1 Tax=Fulvivirga aurantia TaxID=2529383 RepID=UPI0016246FE1
TLKYAGNPAYGHNWEVQGGEVIGLANRDEVDVRWFLNQANYSVTHSFTESDDNHDPETYIINEVYSPGTISGPSDLCEGNSGTYTVTNNSSTIEYWQSRNKTGSHFWSSWSTVPGSSQSSSISFNSLSGDTQLKATILTGACGEVVTDVFTISYTALPSENQIIGREYLAGGGCGSVDYEFEFAPEQQMSPATEFQWQYSLNNIDYNSFNDLDILRDDQDRYVINFTESTYVRVRYYNSCGESFSNVVFVEVLEANNGGVISGLDKFCDPQNISLIVSGASSVIEWYSRENGNPNWTNLGSNPFPVYLSETTHFKIIADNSICPVQESETFTVVKKNVPILTYADNRTEDLVICEGQDGKFLLPQVQLNIPWGENMQLERSIEGGPFMDYFVESGTYIEITTTQSYRLRFDNFEGCGLKYSNTLNFILINQPEEGTLPDFDVCHGVDLTLELTGNGGTITGWEKGMKDTDGKIIWASYNSSTQSQLQLANITEEAYYRAVLHVDDRCDDYYSDISFINIVENGEVGRAIGSRYLKPGNNSGSVRVHNLSGNVVEWQISRDNGEKWTTGSTAEKYTYKNLGRETLAKAIIQFGIGCDLLPTNEVKLSMAKEYGLNMITSTTYDEDGQTLGASRSYFDESGQLLQSQSRDVQNSTVIINQPIKDEYDRAVFSALASPTDLSNFFYQPQFIENTAGNTYTYSDLGNPVGNSNRNTLGWYYSENNDIEDNVPVTGFPYSLSEFYNDGSGAVRRTAGPGEVHRMGSGNESWNGTFAVSGELADYFTLKALTLPGIPRPTGDLANESTVSVRRDVNGKFSLSVSDRQGNVLMSALKGNRELSHTRTNSEGNFIYFYLLNPATVNFTSSGSYQLENIITDDHIPVSGGSKLLNPGFYRVISSATTTINYRDSYGNVSYNFYDNAGRLRCTVSPNGVKQWREGIAYANIDKTTYMYNHQGWLLSTTEPDAGTTVYLYRTDGTIRFSQNQKQKENGRFSYTDYDNLGRPIESGEYTGSLLFGTDTNAILENLGFNSWSNSDKTDWVKTYYDQPVTSIPNVPASVQQDFVMGAASYTENEHITTWYSYDEQGRVTWMAQKPNGLSGPLSRTFLLKYDYDFLGNVLQVGYEAYGSDQAKRDAFYHYYTYDANKRLDRVYTSLNGSIPYVNLPNETEAQLQASYTYYLHGPLKRIELGGDMQGIDFVYNINGWLERINSPDDLSDESGFMEDAFSMLLNYYKTDMTSLFQVSSFNPKQDPKQFHQLPNIQIQPSVDIAHLMQLYRPFVPELENKNLFKEESAEQPKYLEQLEKLSNEEKEKRG